MNGQGEESTRGGKPWFDVPNEDLAKTLVSQVGELEQSPLESTRRDNLLYDLELYFGTKLQSLYATGDQGTMQRFWQPDAILFNVCYSITNTIRNRICSFRPRAQFLPNGGDYKAGAAAEAMTDMSDAWAVETGLQAQASLAFRDLLTGDGCVLKIYKEDNKVKAARFPAWEFYFDEAESIYGDPDCAYHVTYMALEQAAAKYDVDEFLLATQVSNAPTGILYITNRQMVRIVESWKRARGEEGDEGYQVGKHAVVVGEQMVGEPEEWKYDGFPLVTKNFDENSVGMWGVGPVRILRADQLELIKEQESMRAAHEKNSKMVAQVQDSEDGPTKINNDYVRIERYKNTPTVYTNPAAVNAEEYEYIDLIWKKAYDKIGISQFLAAGTKQPGTTSAVAIDASSEMQSDRLALCSQIWEGMFVEAATWWWRFTKELAKAGKKCKWRAIQRGVWRELVFDDLDGDYEIRPFPSSIFGQTVSGRLNKAMQAVEAGWIERDDALRAIDVPDLAPITNLILAPKFYMENLVDNILEKGKYVTPSPYIKPEDMQAYARNRYLLAMSDESNYPEEHLALLRRLIDSLSPPPAPPLPTGAPGVVPAAPGTLPVVPAIPGAPMPGGPAPGAEMLNGPPNGGVPPQ